MSYPLVHITNSTQYAANGVVSYASIFCSNDNYNVAANGGTWQASSRGACLVTEVSATLAVNGNPVNATPYSSSGTSYSQFAIIQTGPGAFQVTRVTSLAAHDVETKLPEPTEQQK